MAASDRDIQDAERAKLEEAVNEHGTSAEQALLLFSSLRAAGTRLTEMAATAERDEAIETVPPDPELLAKLARRAERRTKLKFPKAECAADPPAPSCLCLERGLDHPGDDGARVVRKLAAAFHQRPRREPEPTPDPRESSAEPPEATESVEEPPAEPSPPPKPEATPPVRVVHRTRKWFDDFERPHFSRMKF